jgi:hypothetical protein
MRGELNFQKYSRLLGEGLFADNIILSIIDYRENRRLEPAAIEVLKRAKKFFDDVIEGERLQSSVIRSARDINAAKAYNSVQPIRVRLSQLCDLRDTIEEILNNNPVNEQKINRLDNFFSSYSRIKFQRAKSVLESV